MKIDGCVFVCGGSAGRAIATINKLEDTYGDIKMTELVSILIQPRPQWSVVVREWCTNGRGKMVSEVYHKSFTGNWNELEYWVHDEGFELIGWDGPYYHDQKSEAI